MKTLIVDNHSKHTQELAAVLEGSIVIPKELFSKEQAEDFDLIVFSGGSGVPSVVDHAEYYQDEIDFVRNTNKRVLGICLGCEIICEAFGGILKFLPEKEFGDKIFQVTDKNLCGLVGDTINCYEAHMVGMIKIPENLEVCIVSEHGAECITHQAKPINGSQFNPEIGGTQNMEECLSAC